MIVEKKKFVVPIFALAAVLLIFAAGSCSGGSDYVGGETESTAGKSSESSGSADFAATELSGTLTSSDGEYVFTDSNGGVFTFTPAAASGDIAYDSESSSPSTASQPDGTWTYIREGLCRLSGIYNGVFSAIDYCAVTLTIKDVYHNNALVGAIWVPAVFIMRTDKSFEVELPNVYEDTPENEEISENDKDNATPVPDGMVYVKGGTVTGATDGSKVFIDGRTVEINNLYACDHPVTQHEYKKYVNYEMPASYSKVYYLDGSWGYKLSLPYIYSKGTNYPVKDINWYEAILYCNLRSIDEGLEPVYTIEGSTNPEDWVGVKVANGKYELADDEMLNPKDFFSPVWDTVTMTIDANGYRLPTEAEWEYLARGGVPSAAAWNYKYPGSNTRSEVGWVYEGKGTKISEVKQKKANTLGLYDMSGPVRERCWDWTNVIDAETPSTGPTSTDAVNIPGFSYGGRIVRGDACNWWNPSCYLSIEARWSDWPGLRSSSQLTNAGFRVVRTAE